MRGDTMMTLAPKMIAKTAILGNTKTKPVKSRANPALPANTWIFYRQTNATRVNLACIRLWHLPSVRDATTESITLEGRALTVLPVNGPMVVPVLQHSVRSMPMR